MVNPDIIGYTLEDAVEALMRHGMEVNKISVTAPPRKRNVPSTENSPVDTSSEGYRVLRVKAVDNEKAELLVCKPL